MSGTTSFSSEMSSSALTFKRFDGGSLALTPVSPVLLSSESLSLPRRVERFPAVCLLFSDDESESDP